MTQDRSEREEFLLNGAIGFLGILLFILVTALLFRLIYPRIQNERVAEDPVLIGNIIQLEDLNGCGVPGVAGLFTSTLRTFGFDVVESGNFDHFDLKETILVSRNGNMENARRVARALDLPEDRILLESSGDYFLDATLIIGSDYSSFKLESQ